jgi:hypothetical protein
MTVKRAEATTMRTMPVTTAEMAAPPSFGVADAA